jgi:hypothetical protein
MRLLNQNADVVADELAQHLVHHRHRRLVVRRQEAAKRERSSQLEAVDTVDRTWRRGTKHGICAFAPSCDGGEGDGLTDLANVAQPLGRAGD